jgi:hypothetical protein
MTQCPNRLLLVTSSLSARSSRRIRKIEPPSMLDHLVVPQVVDVPEFFWLQREPAAQLRISPIIAKSVHLGINLNERGPHLMSRAGFNQVTEGNIFLS